MNLKDLQASTLRHTVAAAAALCLCTTAFADTIYSSMPSPQPSNVPSFGYQATQLLELGSLVSFAPGARNLTSVSVLMSSWALESSYEAVGASNGFAVPLTLKLYNVGNDGAVGSLITTANTKTVIAPWRPEAAVGQLACPNGTGWRDANGDCFNGLAFKVTFDFTDVVVPDSLIYGLSFNTGSYGTPPIGADGPYNSLNFGAILGSVGPSVGSTPLGTVYMNSTNANNYTDHGVTGTFRQDTRWDYVPSAQFEAVPEPASIALLGLGLAGVAFSRRKRSK